MSFIKNILASLLRRLKLLGPEIVRYNDLKAYPMVNSITLSSDMNTLYLIDDGRAVPFKLQKEKMILVGLLKDQITVATSLAPDEKLQALEDERAELSISGALLRGGDAKKGGVVKVPVEANTQWSVVFNRKYQVMALIGAVEINPGLTSENPNPLKPQGFLFDLKEVVVGISRIGNALILTPLSREEKLSS